MEAIYPKTRNKHHSRYIFRITKREADEDVNKLTLRLEQLVKHCRYECPECKSTSLEKDLVLDQLIHILDDEALRLKTLSRPKVTLEEFQIEATQREQLRAQIKDINGQSTDTNVYRAQYNKNECGQCGLAPHKRSECPAKDTECGHCQKTGHWKKKCFDKDTLIGQRKLTMPLWMWQDSNILRYNSY